MSQGELITGIYVTKHEMSNMTLERIVVSNDAIVTILENCVLSQQAQEEAVMLLVDRTPEWQELEQEEAISKIKTVLTQETVLEYLKETGTITSKCDTVQLGIDPEGSIVVEAYYTNLNREQRRAVEKAMSEKQRQDMFAAVNALGGDEKLVDLAAKKLEKLRKEGMNKVVPPKRKK